MIAATGIKTIGIGKTCFFIVLFSIVPGKFLLGQVLAGGIPSGMSKHYNVIDLSVMVENHDTNAYFDINGDGTHDIHARLYKSETWLDGINYVDLFVLDLSYSFCVDNGQGSLIALFEFGDTLCGGNQEWRFDSVYRLACFYCWYSESVIENKYIGFRSIETGDIGWMKISMNIFSDPLVVQSPDTLTFKVEELLVPYIGVANLEPADPIEFKLIPNPTVDGRFIIQSAEKISVVELYNSEGQLVGSSPGIARDWSLPETKGLYLVRVRNEKGEYSQRKLIRL